MSSNRIIYIFIILFHTNFVHSEAAMTRPKKYSRRELTAIKKTMDKLYEEATEEFNCRTIPPPKRVFTFKEIVKEAIEKFEFNENSTKIVHPPVVLLHRCDSHSGCCMETDKTCSVKETKTVTLPFHISDPLLTTNGDPFDNGDIVYLTFIDHTKCDCV